MTSFPKFIVEGEDLIIAKCTYHKQLASDETQVKGGGWFDFDGDKTFRLHGESHDFGRATFEDIKNCIDKGNVWNNSRCTRPLGEGYKFVYDTQSELIELN